MARARLESPSRTLLGLLSLLAFVPRGPLSGSFRYSSRNKELLPSARFCCELVLLKRFLTL